MEERKEVSMTVHRSLLMIEFIFSSIKTEILKLEGERKKLARVLIRAGEIEIFCEPTKIKSFILNCCQLGPEEE